jgi:hypothetical protein
MRVREGDQNMYTSEGAEVAKFTKRIVVLEEPRVAVRMEELARASGHSTAAEVRGAIRWWIRSLEYQENNR